ncbi:MAG: hypothetical protein QOF91_3379, partial [Alphaproteobacteria bacterium]|nr:hypothetical protein [Alphaproteobacteria bacterium]
TGSAVLNAMTSAMSASLYPGPHAARADAKFGKICVTTANRSPLSLTCQASRNPRLDASNSPRAKRRFKIHHKRAASASHGSVRQPALFHQRGGPLVLHTLPTQFRMCRRQADFSRNRSMIGGPDRRILFAWRYRQSTPQLQNGRAQDRTGGVHTWSQKHFRYAP